MFQDLENAQLSKSSIRDQWNIVLKKLNSEYGNEIFNSWIKNISIKNLDNDIIYFTVPTRFIRDWITSHYLDKIIYFLNQENPDIKRVKISIDNALTSNMLNLNKDISSENNQIKASFNSNSSDDWPLDERFTFDKFITGPTNELAFASAKRLCSDDTYEFNPLYVYGGVGLGKTHLLHAIAWQISEEKVNSKVLYLSAERFMFQFIKSLRQKDTMTFKQKFRSADVLIIDDIQFMIGKNSTQEEFFHTFNTLIDHNHQVVISADRSPVDLDGIEERIRSRLGWGLVTDIHASDYELRLGVLQTKAKKHIDDNPEIILKDNILEFLAQRIDSNIRVLEGALNRVIAYSSFVGRPLTTEMAQEVLKDLIRASQRRITIDDIQRKVADYYNLRLSDLLSARRSRTIARPRQVAMYLSKVLTTRSLPEIGRKFGGRDHTTVIHAVKRIESLQGTDTTIQEEVDLLSRSLEG